MGQFVKDFMKSPVQAIKSSKTIRQAASSMKSNGFGSLLVIHDGEMGIITERDLVHALSEYGENTPIVDHISMPLITINQDDKIADAVKLMLDNRIRRLVVVDENKKVMGIINMRDIVESISDLIMTCFD